MATSSLEREERMACDVDTGAVFKHPVHCFGCDQAFYFTLRKIAEAKKLACPLCGFRYQSRGRGLRICRHLGTRNGSAHWPEFAGPAGN